MSGRDSLVITFTAQDDLLSFTPYLDGDQTLLSAGFQDVFNSLFHISKMGLVWKFAVFLHVTIRHQALEEFTVNADADDFKLLEHWAWDHIMGTEGLLVLSISEDILACDHGLG